MPIKEIPTNSLDDFWNVLSPIGSFIGEMHNPIFRGQGDSTWPLTPSALREDIISKYCNACKKNRYTDHIVSFEHALLSDFLYYADEMGLMIPRDSPEFRKSMDFFEFTDRYGEDGVGWPSAEYFSFIALAQHHGIPTRLLDWTRNPIVAGYFSASQVLNAEQAPENLSVWVVDTDELRHLNGALELVRLPGSTSQNLAAQKGVFLIHRQPNCMGRSTVFSSEGLKNSVNKLFEESNDCTAYKVTLPSHFAGELLFRCHKFGISAATLFPDFDGAARAALEFKMAKKLSGKL